MGTAYIGRRTLRDILSEQADSRPESPFLTFEALDGSTTRLNYGEFERLTNRLANGLMHLGVTSGTRVAINVGNSVEHVATWWAVVKLGAVAVVCSPDWAPDEFRHAVETTTPSVLVADSGVFAGEWGDARHTRDMPVVICRGGAPEDRAISWVELVESGDERAVPMSFGSETIAELLFTSGSTARPKAAMITHATCLLDGERWAFHQGLRPSNRVLCPYPIYHNNAQSVSMLGSATAGAELILLERFSARRFVGQCMRYRPTHMTVLPPVIRAVLAQPDLPDSLTGIFETMMLGPAITPAEHAQWEGLFGIRLMRAYGQTEAFVGIAASTVHRPLPSGAIGRPALYRSIRIVDDAGKDVQLGEVGEILVDAVPGFSVMLGYYNDLGATAEVIRGGWLWTGDYGHMDSGGYIYFDGRKKDVMKPLGYSVAPAEVERVILSASGVRDCAVFGVADVDNEEVVVASVVLDVNVTPSAEELDAACQSQLAHYKVPSYFMLLDEIPRNVSHKPDKRRLRVKFNELFGVPPGRRARQDDPHIRRW